MNYGDWVKTFKNRTPEQLRELINAINVLEKDVDINREFDDVGLFAGSSGCSIRGAAKEALNKVSADQPNSKVSEVVSAKLKGEM